MSRPVTRKPLYVAKTSIGVVEVVKVEQTPELDIYVTHVMNNDWDKTLVRYDRRGERYFRAHGQKIYLADLRKVTCLN